MTENPFLFIGGPADGKRINVTNPGEDVRYATPSLYGEKIDVYRGSKIGGSTKTFRVYVFAGMTGDQVIALLLTGYKGGDAG